jgi:deazaflavin-dependent oxidoreductase (nitroreductase family)
MTTTPPLRRLLADQVAERRREREGAEEADRPTPGAFTTLNEETTIHFCTIGRKTGEKRDKWWIPYAADGDTLYLIEENGTRAQWVKNLLAYPGVEVWGRDGKVIKAKARLVIDKDEDVRARQLVNARFDAGDWDLINHGTVVAFDRRT